MENVKVHPEKVRGIEGLRAQMIGREREFDDLKDATDDWQSGQGQIISIIGEAGIGKSRLVTELKSYLNESQHTNWFEGRCISIGQPISYWLFLDILRTHFGLREDDTEAVFWLKPCSRLTTCPMPSKRPS